ncbi:MAG TPA: BamA/TamA family outer membrane protein [Flavobacteriales bacterium]|nr:BamA/TamA family outer membrane protein [Flavobacteriales bacterium]
MDNVVEVEGKGVSRSELDEIIKQQPNEKILGARFYLSMYNWPDPDKIAEARARKDAARDRKNDRRAARGKAPKPYSRTTAEWLREVVGEPPVLLDSSLTRRSSDQMRLYLQKEGHFNGEVTDSISFARPNGRPYHKPKARVIYSVEPGRAYSYCTISLRTDDPTIRGYLREAWPDRLVMEGDRFDADVLDRERTRITNRLRELGYLHFTRDLVQFDADTSAGDREVDLVVRVERPGPPRRKDLTGTPEGTIYQVADVEVDLRPRQRGKSTIPPDTIQLEGYRFLYQDRVPVKPQALLGSMFLRPDARYQQSHVDRTYRRLTALRAFDRVDIAFDSAQVRRPDQVNAKVRLIPARTQSVSVELYGTNRGGFLGTQLSLNHRHKNLFRSLGSIQTSMILGFEAQQSLTGGGTNVADDGVTDVGRDGLFNTLEIGPEVTLTFPQFLIPISRDKFSRSADPRSVFHILYNYQRRPDYTRNLARFSFGYEWHESPTKTWGVYPLEWNVIRIPRLSPEFDDYLRQANDPVLTDSYTDHLIVGARLQYTINTRNAEEPRRHNWFYRFSFEPAGNTLYAIDRLVDAPLSTDTTGSSFYTLTGVRYAHFLKFDNDLRHYRVLGAHSNLVARVAAGVGIPLTNLNVLPFESSFFVGGANGLRAWRARTVGPGSNSAPLVAFDRIGEVRIEGNIEYRFDLIGYLEGALFVDLGNIWYLEEEPQRPGSGFDADFLSELAIGTGVGLRLNFDFFLVRFDLGLQTKDPSLTPGERWIFQPKDRYEQTVSELNGSPTTYKPGLNLNLGIGYPF